MTFHSYMCVTCGDDPRRSSLKTYGLRGITTHVMVADLVDDYVHRTPWQFSSVCIDQAHYMTSRMSRMSRM